MLLVGRPHAKLVSWARAAGRDLLVGPTDVRGWTVLYPYDGSLLTLADVAGPAVLLGDEDDPVLLAVRASDGGPELTQHWDAAEPDETVVRVLAETLGHPGAAPEISAWLSGDHVDDQHAAALLHEITPLPELWEDAPSSQAMVVRAAATTIHLAARVAGPAAVSRPRNGWRLVRGTGVHSAALEGQLRSALGQGDSLVAVTRWADEVEVEVLTTTASRLVRWCPRWERSLADPVRDGDAMLRTLGPAVRPGLTGLTLAAAGDPLRLLVEAYELPEGVLTDPHGDSARTDGEELIRRATGVAYLLALARIELRHAAAQDRATRVTVKRAVSAWVGRSIAALFAIALPVVALIIVATDGSVVGWDGLSTYRRTILVVGAVLYVPWAIVLGRGAWRAGRRMLAAALHRGP